MSVTFTADTRDGFATKREPCLCAQMSDHFGAFVRGERTDFEALTTDASPNCELCHGTGAEDTRVDLRPSVNFANGNAEVILEAMGLRSCPTELYGEADLATMKRGIIRARNVNLPDIIREREERKNYVAHGYTRAQLMAAIDELEAVVSVGERRGAKKVTWG